MKIGSYAKSIVMVIAAGIGILTAALSDGVVSPVEYVTIAISILTAIGAYLIPNMSSGVGAYAKTLVAFGGAAAAALANIVAHAASFSEVSQSDWLNVLLAGLAAVGLFIVPNVPKPLAQA